MLMIVGHCACIAIYDGLCIQKEIVWKNDTYAITDNHKHVSGFDGTWLHMEV